MIQNKYIKVPSGLTKVTNESKHILYTVTGNKTKF